ncbi:hypothetical protein DBR28_21345 [Chryseobacterium sp. HMWF028]|nr:hypothetical protein DBR28_21345 [Chryseobacterium sp. HMWF028]
MFPDVPRLQEPTKERKKRRKCTLFSQKENNRRYRLHRKVRKLALEGVKLYVRKRVIELPVMFELDDYPALKELIYDFKYQAPTEFLPLKR